MYLLKSVLKCVSHEVIASGRKGKVERLHQMTNGVRIRPPPIHKRQTLK